MCTKAQRVLRPAIARLPAAGYNPEPRGAFMTDPLQQIRDELGTATARLLALAGSLDDSVWRRRPRDDQWSVAECVQHLNLSATALLPGIRQAVADARARGFTSERPRLRRDFWGWLICRSLEPRRNRRRHRMKTSPPFVPAAIQPRAEVLEEWKRLHELLIAVTHDAAGVDLTRMRVTSPFNAKLHYNAYSALRIIGAHERRHLLQAEQALATIKRQPR